MKLSSRILLVSLVISTSGILVAGLLTSSLLSGQFEARQLQKQQECLRIMETLLGDSTVRSFSRQQWQALLATVGSGSGTSMAIIDAGGTVLAEYQHAAAWEKGSGNPAWQAVLTRTRGSRSGSDRDGDVLSSALRLPVSLTSGREVGYIVASTVLHDSSNREAASTILLATGIVFLGMAILASVIISRQVAKPLVSFVETVNRIRDGETSARIEGSYASELADLAGAINSMAEKLGADITKLERLERVRSEFLGNVSHELRTPIFSLQGFLETLLDGAVDDPSVNRAFLQKALSHSERLSTLLNDLIEISRIESGEMKMSFRYFSILEFLQGIVEEMDSPAAAKQIRLSYESEFDAAAKVYGDKARLRQALINLIDNAIKYTEPGGSVICIARVAQSQCEILVRDSGSGIPAEHLPRIFERFYRVDKDRSREVGGTGLGLAIVKHIVEAHGSTIQVNSTVGMGSIFSFKLKR